MASRGRGRGFLLRSVDNSKTSTMGTVQDPKQTDAANDLTEKKNEISAVKDMHSGQTMNETITSAVIASYSNLTSSPILCLGIMFFTTVMATNIFSLPGPTAWLIEEIKKQIRNENTHKIVGTILRTVLWFAKFLDSWEDWVVKFFFLWVPYIKKPSSKNFKFSLAITVLITILRDITILEIFVFSNLWFLYTEMRNPAFKLFLMALAVFVFAGMWLAETPTPPPPPPPSSSTLPPPTSSISPPPRTGKGG